MALVHKKKNVFVVYTQAGEASQAVVRFLQTIGLNPIPLHDQEPQTVVERFEDYASNSYAVVLLTPDDLGRIGTKGDAQLKPRPGQNVVFKLGYFIGKFGRRYVTALSDQSMDLPEAFSEVLCMPMDEIGIWKFALMRDLVSAGYAVNQNLALYPPRRGPVPTRPRPAAGQK